MTKTKWIALMAALLAMTMLLSACSSSGDDAVVAEVGSVKITKAEAQPVYQFLLDQAVMSYAQQGQQIDTTSSEVVSTLKANTLNIMAETEALNQKLTELGNPITDEERAHINEVAGQEYEALVQQFVETYNIPEDEARTTADSMGYSLFAHEYSYYRQEIEKRLRPFAVSDLTATDEEIQADYDEHLAAAKESYEASPSQFVTDVINGETIYTRPEGFRYVKNLVIGFPEEQNALITEKDNEYYQAMMDQYTAQNELSAATEEMSDEDRAALEQKIEGYNAEFDRIEGEIEAIKKTAYEQMKPEADEILAKAQAAGADFDALMAEYSADSPTGDLAEHGYPVGEGVTNYVQAFTNGAMALTTIGEVSGLIESDYGYHILKYNEDIPAGDVPLEEVRDAIAEHVVAEQEDEAFTVQLEAWLNEAKIKTYINRF